MNRIFAAALVAGVAGASSAQVNYTNPTVLEWGFAGTSAIDSGPVTVYPSVVTAGAGPIADVNVSLNDGAHTWISDFEVQLVSPSGTRLLLMDFAGNTNSDDLAGTVTFDDEAAGPIPETTGAGPVAGSYQVSQYTGTSTTASGLGTDGSALSIFDGEDAGGDWELYVFDQAAGDTGAILGGWTLTIEYVPAPASAALLGLGGLAAARRRR